MGIRRRKKMCLKYPFNIQYILEFVKLWEKLFLQVKAINAFSHHKLNVKFGIKNLIFRARILILLLTEGGHFRKMGAENFLMKCYS